MKTHIIENFRLHATRIQDLVTSMQVSHSPALSWGDSGFKSDTYNIVFVRKAEALEADELEQVQAYYGHRQVAYCCWVPADQLSPALEQRLEDHGLTKQATVVGMGLSLRELDLEGVSEDNIEPVQMAQQLAEYAKVIAANWSPPDKEVIGYFNEAANIYLTDSSPSRLFVYRLNGEVVSTVELFAVDNKTAGIYGLCTLEAFRKQGIGTEMMSFIMHFAWRAGYENLILHASEAGLGIYQRLDFQAETYLYEYA